MVNGNKVGYVYRYVHKDTLKWYIGSHNGSNPNYSGSGTYWRRALEKYGMGAFVKDILYEGVDYMEIEELILTALNAQSDPMSYNLKNQALGGAFFGPLNGMYGKILSNEQRFKCGNAFRGKIRLDHSDKMKGSNNPMFGKNDHVKGLIKYSKSCKGKSREEIFGVSKAKDISDRISDSLKGKQYNWKTVECPHCGKTGKSPNMTRYHFDNCKNKGGIK